MFEFFLLKELLASLLRAFFFLQIVWTRPSFKESVALRRRSDGDVGIAPFLPSFPPPGLRC